MIAFREYLKKFEGITKSEFDNLLQPAIDEIKNRWLDSVRVIIEEKGSCDGLPKRKSLLEVKEYFEPDLTDPWQLTEEEAEELESWEAIESVEAMQEHLDRYVNIVDGVKYHNYTVEEF